jgi:hypothetical protein
MQAVKQLRTEKIKENGHIRNGNKSGFTGRCPMRKAITAHSLPVPALNISRSGQAQVMNSTMTAAL